MTPTDTDPHAWLETDAIRRISDFAFGAIMLVVAALALWVARDYVIGTLTRLGPGAFPAVVAGLLCLVGVVLLLRAALRRSPPVRRSRPLYIAIAAASVLGFVFAERTWGPQIFPRFGPAEFMAVMTLDLAVAIALAHSSRTRAAGMALLGLLLSTVGTDVNSGVARFTMGLDELMDGISVDAVLFGLFVLGDAFVCLASPSLFLRTYTRLVTAWRAPPIRVPAVFVMRLVAALAVAGVCYYVYSLSHSVGDVVLTLVFGALGVAAKIFGWNRFLPCMGMALGALLEENIRRALLLTRGDPLLVLQRPICAALTGVAAAILTAAAMHSVRRVRTP